MAKESSILKLKGKLDGMVFYKTSEGYQVRAKGGISRERIMSERNFARTRENMSEFADINKSGKLIRDGIGRFLNRAKETRSTSRLVSAVAKVKNLDSTSKRGQRRFATGIATDEGKALLEGFSFNQAANLDSILKAHYELDTAAGTLSFASFDPQEDLEGAPSATHVTIGYACCGLNLETMRAETQYAERAVIPVDGEPAKEVLTLAELPAASDVQLHLILVEFLQEVNGEMYPLKNGAYNSLQIVKVV